MCGAYHSLALVRSLPPNSYNSQKPSEKRERGHSPHYLAAEREELFVGDSGLYCPLGVELTEGMAAEVNGSIQTASSAPVVATCRFGFLRLPPGDVQGEGSILEEVRPAAVLALLLTKTGKQMLKTSVRSRHSPMKPSYSISSRSSPIIHWSCCTPPKTPTH